MHTRKLILVEYDEDGNEVDRNVAVENEGLINYFGEENGFLPYRFLLDKDQREAFSVEQWKIIKDYDNPNLIQLHFKDEWVYSNPLLGYQSFRGCPKFDYAELNQEAKKFWDSFFKLSESMQAYILHTPTPDEDPYESDKISVLQKRWEWAEKIHGVYNAVNSKGEVVKRFGTDMPTLKQAKYYRQKYGCSIVYLSFDDWNQYVVNESELG